MVQCLEQWMADLLALLMVGKKAALKADWKVASMAHQLVVMME